LSFRLKIRQIPMLFSDGLLMATHGPPSPYRFPFRPEDAVFAPPRERLHSDREAPAFSFIDLSPFYAEFLFSIEDYLSTTKFLSPFLLNFRFLREVFLKIFSPFLNRNLDWSLSTSSSFCTLLLGAAPDPGCDPFLF